MSRNGEKRREICKVKDQNDYTRRMKIQKNENNQVMIKNTDLKRLLDLLLPNPILHFLLTKVGRQRERERHQPRRMWRWEE